MLFRTLRRSFRIAGLSLLALAGLTCRDRSLTGPGLTAPGKLRIAPSVSAAAAPFGPAFTLGGVRVTLTPYPGTGDPVIERVATFASGQSEILLDLTVQLTEASERFVLRIAAADALAPHDTIFRSVDTVEVNAGTDAPTPKPIALVYDGQDKDIASITVEPVDTTFRTTDNVQMRAVAKRADGTVVTGARLGYSVGEAASAQISTTGMIGARSPSVGFTSMLITVGSGNGIIGTTRITGHVPVVAVQVASAGGVTEPVTGTTLQLTGTVRGPNQVALTDRVVTWSTSNAQRATVSQSGLVTAGPDTGTVTITFASEGVSAELALRVRLVPVAAVRIALPSPLPSFETGDTLALTATTEGGNGQPLAGRQVVWSTTTPAFVRVLDDGRVIALAPGAAQVTATAEGVSASVPLIVVRPAVASLVLGPEPFEVTRGSAASTQVALIDKRGNSLTGRVVAYASTRVSVAQVDADGIVIGFLANDTASVIATSEGKADTVHVTVLPRPVASIVLTPDSSDAIVGQVRPISASVRDAQGNANGDFPIVWRSLTPDLASVDGEGVVTALAAGRAVIRVTAGSASAEAVVQVRPVPVARVVISPRSDLLMRSQDTLRLTAAALDAGDNVLDGRVTTWAVVDGPVSVLQDGRVIAGVVTAATQARVSATVEGLTDVVTITVAPQPVASLVLTPEPLSVVRGETAQLAVALGDVRGHPLSGRAVAFVSSRPTVASVDANGVVTGLVANDTASVIASSEGRADTVHVTVAPRPVRLVTVTPDSVDLIVGRTVQLAAVPRDVNDAPTFDYPTAFDSPDQSIATVSSDGLVTAAGVGKVRVRARSGEGQGFAVVNVIQAPVARVVVSPDAASMFSQDTITLSGTALDASGGTLEGRAFAWAVLDGPVTVLEDGRVIAGVVTEPTLAHVSVSSGGQSATATITVSPQPVDAVELSPELLSVVRGSTAQLTTALRDRRGHELSMAGRTVIYVSTRPSVASVDRTTGVVAGILARDTASVIATSEGRADTVHVTVLPRPVASISITPDSQDVIVGRIGQITAAAFDDRQQANPDFPVAFQSLDPNVATVDAASGVVTAVAAGRVVIRATAADVSADAVVRVRPVPALQVVITPNPVTLFSQDTVDLGGVLVDAVGQPIPGRTVTWSLQSGPVGVEPIDGNRARIIAQTVGQSLQALVVATSDDGALSGTVFITVSPQPVASIVLTPEPLSVERGNTAQLNFSLRDRRGSSLDDARTPSFSSSNVSVARVDGSGLVTGLAVGTAELIAAIEGTADTVHITVTPRAVKLVTVTPDSVDVVVGQTVQLTAVPLDPNDVPTFDIPVSFTSPDQSIATVGAAIVQPDRSTRVVATAVAQGKVRVRARAGEGQGFAVVNVIPAPVARVVVAPSDGQNIGSRDTLQLMATAFDAQNNVLTGRTFTWAWVDGPVTVLPDGLVIAGVVTAPANAHVRVTSEGQSATALITVNPQPVAALVLTPEPLSVVRGNTAQLTVVLRDRRGYAFEEPRPTSYVSTRPSSASVDQNGLVAGLIANDTASVIAISETRADTVHVTVLPRPLASLSVEPTSARLFVGETVTIVPTRLDAQGQPNGDYPVTFESLNPAVATVDRTTGVVTAVAGGQATIRASADTFTADATITAALRVNRLVASPRESRPMASIGDQTSLFSQAFAGETEVFGVSVSWVSKDPAVAVIASTEATSAGVRAQGNGSAWIVVRLVADTMVRDSVMVTVAQEIASLAISPDTATRYLGTFLQYSVAAGDARQNAIPAQIAAAQLGWSTLSAGQVVSVDGNGLATMAGLGTDSVIVASTTTGARAAAFVTVRSAIARIFMPADQHVATALGEVLTFSAFPLDTAGTPMTGVPLSWASSNPSVLRFDSVGVGGVAYFTALNNGQADVTATAQGQEGRTSAIVNQRLAQIRLEPAVGATLTIGGTLVIQGTYFDRNGFPMQAQQQPSFGIRNEQGEPPGTSVIRVDPTTGVVTALGRGSADVVATLSNVTSNAVRVQVQGLAVVFSNDKIQVGTRTSTSVQMLLNGVAGAPVNVLVYAEKPSLVQLSGNAGGDNGGAGLIFPSGTTSATLTVTGVGAGTTRLYAVQAVCNDGCRPDPNATLIPDTADVTVASAMSIESPVHVARGDSALTRLILQDPAPAGGLTVDFQFSQPGVVAVIGAGQSAGAVNTVVVPAGLLAADIYVRGLFQGATDITPIARNSSVPGFRQSALVSQGQLFLLSYLDYFTGDTVFVLGQGQTGDFYAESNVITSSAPGDSLRVALGVADGRIASTDAATVVVPPGQSYAPFRLRGLEVGRTTMSATAANAGVWLPANRAVRITTPHLRLTSDLTGTAGQPPATPLSAPSTVAVGVTDSIGNQHGRLTPLVITLRSTNPAVATVDSAQVTLQPGDFINAISRIRFVGPGTANIVAEAAGHRPDTVGVTVVAGKLQFVRVPPDFGNAVPVSSITLPIAQIVQSVRVLAPGAVRATTPLSFRRLPVAGGPFASFPAAASIVQNATDVAMGDISGMALGTDRIEVSSPGYEPDTLEVAVIRGQLATVQLPDTVHVGNTGGFWLRSSTDLPIAGRMTVTGVSSNPALFSITGGSPATFPGGLSSSSSFNFSATAPGTAQLTFTPDNPNYDVLVRAVVVSASKLVGIFNSASRVPATLDTIGIGQRVAPGVRVSDNGNGATTNIRIRSLDPQIALVGPGTTNDTTVFLCFDCNEFEEHFHVRGVGRGIARIELTDRAGVYLPDTIRVVVAAGRLMTSIFSIEPDYALPSEMVAGEARGIEVLLSDSISITIPGRDYHQNHFREAAETLAVRLSSSNESVMRFAAPYVRVPRDEYRAFLADGLVAVGPGTATITLEDSATFANRGNPAFVPRYAPVSKTITVTGSALMISQYAYSGSGDDELSLGMRQRFGYINAANGALQNGLYVCINGQSNRAATRVLVSSSQLRVAQVATGFDAVTIPAGTGNCGRFDVIAQDSIGVVAIAVRAVDANNAPLAGIAPDTVRLDVGRPRLFVQPPFAPVVVGQSGASMTVWAADQSLQFRFPAENVAVALSTDALSVLTVPGTATIPTTAQFVTVTLTGVGPGQARVQAADARTTRPPGLMDVRYAPATTGPITVRGPALQFVTLTPSMGIRQTDAGLQVQVPTSRPTGSPLVVNLSIVGGAELATLGSASVTIPGGQSTSPPFTLNSVAGAGNVVIQATAAGHEPATLTRPIAPGRLGTTAAFPSAIALGDSVAVTFAPFDPSGSFERTLTAAQSFVMNLPQQLELWTGGANSAQIANNTITLPTAGAAGGASRVTVYVKAVNIGTGVMTSSSNANFQSYSSPGTTVTMRWAYMGLGSAALDPQTGNATLGFHACGVAMNGRGYCWGDNGEGQLGNGGSTASMVPVPVAGNRLFSLNPQQRSGELGDAHSCGVSSTGVGFCAGRGAEGQLGTGGTGQQTTLVDIPGFTFTYVAGGQGFTCGISATDQTTYCWGRGAPMGATAAPNGSATPQPVIGTRNGDAAGIKFTFVSAGLNSACGITGPGRIYCWGSSGRGQLGNGAQVTGTQLFEVPQQTPVVGVPAVIWRTVRVGAEFACGTALMSTTPVASGLIYCWGRNDFGQLGATANTGPNPRPLLVAPQSAASRFLSLAVGGTHACAVDINQEMWCWGRNNRGQLGNNGVTNSSAMVQVVRGGSGIPAGRVLAIIDAGAEATCAVAAFSQTSFSGEAYCWGASTNGQLGNGVPSGSSYTTPQRVTDPAPPAAGGLSAPRTIAGRLQ